MRIEVIINLNEKEDKYGIRFYQNAQSFDLFARAKDVQDKWIAKLKEFCVFTNFATNYNNIKVVGKGSFAKVYIYIFLLFLSDDSLGLSSQKKK